MRPTDLPTLEGGSTSPEPALPDVHRLRAEAIRYGAPMLRHFGWFYHLLGLGGRLRRVRIEDHSVERIRAAASRGPIVYVLLRRSAIDHLALNTVLNRRRLPISVWANGITSFWWQPVRDAWRDVARRVRAWLTRGRRPDAIASGWLTGAVAAGAPITLFLEDDRTLAQRLSRATPPDPLDALLEAQAVGPRPIQLLPVLVVWDRGPVRRAPTVRAFLLGARERPTLFARLRRLYAAGRGVFVQVGEPVDLGEVVARVEPARRARTLRVLLRRYLRRESTVVRGPALLPQADMRRIVLDNPPMRELARREAVAGGKAPERVRRQMERDFDAIAANFRWWVIKLAHVVLRPLWTRVFSGVDVREEDVERIRSAMRDGTAILVPSHKSHFDYVLLSWVFYENDLIVPHVVAGNNLAIWPLTIFLRGAGGFFVKRSFGGDRIFAAVFARYLRELVRQGYPVEFFIEGGRTRTGRLLPPRLGVLGMVLDAAELRPTGREVTLLPIALAYEQVAEEQAYARELSGGSKRPESVGQLFRARSVLRRRFGRVHLRVGEPIPCSALVDGDGASPAWSARDAGSRKELLQRLGERVIHRIGRCTLVLPSSLVALALLAHHRRGVRHGELLDRALRLRALLAALGASESSSLERTEQAVGRALDRFVRAGLLDALDHDGERVWSVRVDERLKLDFYKNQVIHLLAPAGLALAAVRGLPPGPFSPRDALPGFRYLLWLTRRDLAPDPDRSTPDLLEAALDALVGHGALGRDDDALQIADTARAGELHGLVRSVLEGYRSVLVAARDHLDRHPDREELVRRLLTAGPALLRAGLLARPESLSRDLLRHAVASLIEEGVLHEDERGRLHDVPERRENHVARLSPMVG